MTPTCPPHYTCTFAPKDPPYHYAQWWDGPWGIGVAVLAVVAFVVVATTLIYWVANTRQDRLGKLAQERREQAERAQKLALEEQRTMQLDSAKGNPEMLKIIQEMQR